MFKQKTWLIVLVIVLALGMLIHGVALAANSALQFNGTNQYVKMGRALGTIGTITNGATFTTAVPAALGSGRALRFNGTNQYVTFGAAPELGVITFTLEVWFNWTGGGNTTSTCTGGLLTVIPLVSKGRGEADGGVKDMNFLMGIQNSRLVADFEEGAGMPVQGLNHPVTGTTAISTNTWHHAAATYDCKVWRLYLDGVLDGTQTITTTGNIYPRSDSTQHAGLASAMTSSGTAQGYFAGSLDEARIWNYARTQAEIQGTMNQQITSGAGLVRRWGLNEGSGTLVGSNPTLGATTFTIEFWFKRIGAGVASYTGTGGVVAIPLVSKGMAESDNSNVDMNYFVGIATANNRLVADIEEGAGQPTPGLNHPVTGTTTIANNTWYHTAVTYDGSTWRVYLNGGLEISQTVTGSPFPRFDSIQHFALASALQQNGLPGSSSGYGPGYFQGVLDEVRIWNYARTQSEIQTDMVAEVPSAPGLIGRWGMNEGAGATIADSSGSGFTGTLMNAPTWAIGFPSPTAIGLADFGARAENDSTRVIVFAGLVVGACITGIIIARTSRKR